MLVNLLGNFYRKIPPVKGKGLLAQKLLSPFVRGKGYEVVVETTSRGGGKLICNLDDLIPWYVYIYGSYQIEKKYEEFVIRKARYSNVVFDIGANIGYYTIQFSRVVGRNGKVHSFEPCAYQMDTLERNVKLNSIDNVVTHKLIVSDRDDEVKKIYFSGMANTGSSSLEVKTDDYEQVACITIDKYCMVNDINSVDIVKIDVEGHELSVLKGMQNILGNGSVKHLFLEINNHALSSGQTSGHEIISFLQKFGYMPFSIANGIPEDYERGQSESLVYFCRSH